VREGIIKQNPFLSFKSDKSTATHKTLTREELDKLMNVPLHPHSKESLCRDAFVFAVFTGMAFIDVKNLTADKITIMDDGSRWISSRRVKTGSPFSVKLMDIPLTIIEKYKSKSKFVFPDMPEHHTIYGVLNRIAKKCGITHRIGFHSARHTFASLITLSEGVPIETVSSMLGHRSLRTTQIYAQLSLDTIAKDILSLARRIEGLYEWID
jgi:integrase